MLTESRFGGRFREETIWKFRPTFRARIGRAAYHYRPRHWLVHGPVAPRCCVQRETVGTGGLGEILQPHADNVGLVIRYSVDDSVKRHFLRFRAVSGLIVWQIL